MTSSELQELTASEPLSLEEEYDMQGESSAYSMSSAIRAHIAL
jgi:hypothetical protein